MEQGMLIPEELAKTEAATQELIEPEKGAAVALRDEPDIAHELELAKQQNRGAAPIAEEGPKAFKYSLPELRKIGEIMYASGMFKDLKSVQQTMVKLLAGSELGYGPFQSLRAFHVIEGKPVETSGEVTARIQRSDKYRMRTWFINDKGDKHDPIRESAAKVDGCVVVISLKEGRKWVDLEPSVFRREDAVQAGLAGKTVWKQYFRNMAFARALTNAARFHCADLFGGPIYTPEELGAEVTIDGEGVEALTGSSAPPPAANGNGEKPDRTVDNEQTRATGVETCTRFASNRKIPDAHRHEIAQAFFGRASTKELNTFELRQLYDLLRQYVKDRGEDYTEPALSGFEDWLTYQVDTAKAANAG